MPNTPPNSTAASPQGTPVLGPWETRSGQTYNGCRNYWTVQRRNSSFRYGYEQLNTPRGYTRRFFDEAKAEKYAEKLNQGLDPKPALPKAQRDFLSSYLADIISGHNADLAHADRDEFIRRVIGMEFENRCPSTEKEVRTARSIRNAGLLAKMSIRDFAKRPWITVLIFSKEGANTLFEINAADKSRKAR